MLCLGIDPDTKTTGYGLTDRRRPVHASLIEVPNRRAPIYVRKLEMIRQCARELELLHRRLTPRRIAIEGQRIRTDGQARPQDILHLGQVAGALVGLCAVLWPEATLLFPEPSEWKGTARKEGHNAGTLKSLHLDFDPRGGLCANDGERLPGTVYLAKRDSTHVIDGLALALWGYRTAPRELR